MSLKDEVRAWREQLLRDVAQMVANTLATHRTPVRVVDLPFVLGAKGTALAVGDHAFLRLGLNGPATILSWSMAATVGGVSTSGSCALDILVGTTLAGAGSIVDGNAPALAAQAEVNDQPPTSWTVSIGDPRWVLVKVTSTGGTLEVVALTLRLMVG